MSEVLIIGNGGREFELGRALSAANEVSGMYFYEGNAGTAMLPKSQNTNHPNRSFDDVLTIIGPEEHLVNGMADMLRELGQTVLGPSREAAKLEASKAYGIEFMRDNDIPYPPSEIVSNWPAALRYINSRDSNDYVVKADGLTGGKGVFLPKDRGEAYQSAQAILEGKLLDGVVSCPVIFQQRFHGPEVTAMLVSDGKRFTMLPLAQDHKRLKDGDQGPNTGGMGSYAPVPDTIVSNDQMKKIYDIAERSIDGMNKRGIPYQGVLYIGIMLAEETNGDPVVIEYNARFGDPETQVVLPLLEASGSNIYKLLRSAAEGKLDESAIVEPKLGRAALSVCLAPKGYPDPKYPKTGDNILGLDENYENVIIHHAGTKLENGQIVTAGGRALYVTGLGENIDDAAANAYRAIGKDGISFADMQYRRDIGHQARKLVLK